jgi:hypothetical protein
MVLGFRELLTMFCDPHNFTTFEFHRPGQPEYPPPSFKSARADREIRIDDPTKERATRGAPPKVEKIKQVRIQDTTAPEKKICFLSVLRQYKVERKDTNVVPEMCGTRCKKVHYHQLPAGTPRKRLQAAAETTFLLSEDGRAKLLAAILKDKKLT